MNTTSAGRDAEEAVAQKLSSQGFRLLARNWRNRLCEIDIIAQKADVIHFVEVKFRTSNQQGDGLEYLTPKKIKQMTFAAETWCALNDWEGDWRLLGVSVGRGESGYTVGDVVEVN